jgi:hypothetical protein
VDRSIFITSPYEDRVRLIELKSLQIHRLVADIVFIQQILAGHILAPRIPENIQYRINIRNLRSVELFNIQVHRMDYDKNEPIKLMLQAANSDAELFDIEVSFQCFKAKLCNKFSNKTNDFIINRY